MNNTCIFRNNKIFIEAPGNPNNNRIKNDLIWDVNSFLSKNYELYTFYVSKSHTDSDLSFPILGLSKKYIVFHKLDTSFINRRTLSENDISYYRKIMDPLNKMDDDVFREACYMENVDIEYIAIADLNLLTKNKIAFKSIKSFYHWLVTAFPVYISMFSAKELKIVVNDQNMFDHIRTLVLQHCSIK